MEICIMNDKRIDIDTGSEGKGSHAFSQNAGSQEMEERALSVFASERNEDLTALVFCLITTFLVLLFTKWLV
jgi:hypothetical protein